MKEPDFGDYADKLGKSARETLAFAIEESRKRDQHYLAPAHLVLALLRTQAPFFSELIENPATIQSITEELKTQADSPGDYKGSGLKITLDVKTLFRLAWISCFQNGRNKIEAVDFVNALTQIENSPLSMLFRKYGLDPGPVSRLLGRVLKHPIAVKMESLEFSNADKQEVREAIAKDDFMKAYMILHNFYLQSY